jgi:hypothetical protein
MRCDTFLLQQATVARIKVKIGNKLWSDRRPSGQQMEIVLTFREDLSDLILPTGRGTLGKEQATNQV